MEKFVAHNFYLWNESWYRMEPDIQKRVEYGTSEDDLKWDKLVTEINLLANNTLKAFDNYRNTVKNVLLI